MFIKTIPFTLSVICINVRADLKYTTFISLLQMCTPHYYIQACECDFMAYNNTLSKVNQSKKNRFYTKCCLYRSSKQITALNVKLYRLGATFKNVYSSVIKQLYAMDRCKWRKMIKEARWSGWVWVGECFLWYRPTQVVPDQRPLNGRRRCCCC